MRKMALAAVLAATLLLPMPALAKGEGVGLWMEGTVSCPRRPMLVRAVSRPGAFRC